MTAVFDLAQPTPPMRELRLGRAAVTLRPWNGLLACMVEAGVQRELDRLAEGGGLERLGIEAAELPEEVVTPEFTAALPRFLDSVFAASAMIENWTLVGPTGDPVPITPETVSRLFMRGLEGTDGAEILAAFNAQSGR